MDSDPDLEELVQKVDQHYRRLLRETNLKGRRSTKWNGVHAYSKQRAAINKWMRGVKPKTPWEVNCMVYAAAFILRPQKSKVKVQGKRKEKCLHFRRLIAWLDVEITRQKHYHGLDDNCGKSFILWPSLVQTSFSRTRETGSCISLRWQLLETLSWQREEPRSCPSMMIYVPT